jgi:anti-anti-sigma factor
MSEHCYCLRGEVDIVEAPRVRADLQDAIARDGAHLLIDCSQLTFIDSSGVAVLLETHRDLKADGRHMLVVNVPEAPRRVFEALGLSDLLRSTTSTMGGHGCRSSGSVWVSGSSAPWC